MAGHEITFDEVAAAADGLAKDGQAVTVGSLRAALGPSATPSAIHPHLTAWRAARAKPPAEAAELPAALAEALAHWAQQRADEAAARVRDSLTQTEGDLGALLELNEQTETQRTEFGAQLAQVTAERDQALARLTEREASIERLTIELRHARDISTDALVGKAKDQLAIEGKDAQIAELRRQLERHLASSATESDARLAAEMELVGAVTARDNFAAELAELRAQLDAARSAHSAA